jgi:trimethylamine-N-oxide reductase (cytochrome c)
MAAFREPTIECVVAQHPWMENDVLCADIILPTNTTFEVNDIMPCLRDGDSFQSVLLMRKAIEPIGESRSDYEAVCAVAEKLGMLDKVTDGFSEEELIKGVFDGMQFNRFSTWEEFSEKDYFVVPYEKDWQKHTAGWYDFYKDPEKNPIPTPTGKLEFWSESLEKAFPNDEERPGIPKWIEKGITHDERISSTRGRAYPLLVMSNHVRWRVHAQCDDIPLTKETVTGKIRGWDGYLYEPCWMHPSVAEARGIKNGDIVKVYNERGGVLCGALVWERIMPGVLSIDHGARADFITPDFSLDRGGAINVISPEGLTSKHAGGQATSGYLAEVERVTMAQMGEWMTAYPEAFARDYDPASGLRFNSWIVEGR